jgi:hypothetical protein
MRKLILMVFLAAFALPVMADTAQQDKMKSCNAEAGKKALKGDERKKFMSECLSAKPQAQTDEKKLTPQQEKMKSCNAEAGKKALKGDERKKFMSECLSAK